MTIMIDKPIITIAVQTVLFQYFELIKSMEKSKITRDSIVPLADKITEDIHRIANSFHLVTVGLHQEFTVNPENVLNQNELDCFKKFAEMKKVSPESLLRKCILYYCPIDEMIEQLHKLELEGDK